MNQKDKEFLDKLKNAGKQANFFSLKLEYNGSVLIAKRDFSADKYSPESIQKSSLHFILVDCMRQIQEELKKSEQKNKSDKE
jgi:hypothetical protein